jgi:DNA-binding NarL/FixJ family response regulator
MAVALVHRCRPEVAIVDLAMPPPGGHDAIRAIKRAVPETRVLALSGVTDPAAALQALHDGADGFVPKTSQPEELIAPIMTVATGLSVLPPELLAGLLTRADRPGGALLTELDDDERLLWHCVARGESTDEIARRLLVSERTAKRLVASLLRRIGADNRTQAAALAGRSGLLDEISTR